MGRKTDALLRSFRAAKCLTLLKLVTGRIKVLRNKRNIAAKQMRGEIAQLLKSGQDAHVYITKADALIKQENMVACYDIIDQYCHAIISRFPMIEMQSKCPTDMKEPIASLIFAAPRCVELSELASIKEAFKAKYGKEFAAAAAELRPDCGVNKQVIELLSTGPATGDMKLKIMKEICAENKLNWTPGEALAESSTNIPSGSSQQPVKMKMEAAKVTGDAGSSKAIPVQAAPSRVNEAGPSNLSAGTKSALQGDSKLEGTNKPGFAAMAPLKHGVFATDASKSSGIKHGLPPEEGAGKASASVSQSVKGAANTGILSAKSGLATAGSLKTGDGAVFAANAFKTNVTKEESMGGTTNLTGLQTVKGVVNTGISSAVSGSFKESKGEPIVKVEGVVQPAVDAQDGLSDSDNDSFVSVEEERLEDDAEASSMGEAARRESVGKNSLKASVEADVNGSSLIKQPSREARESSSTTQTPHEDVYSIASSKESSFTLESSQEGTFLKASSNNSLNTDALQEEKPFIAESRKSSLKEEKSSGSITESLNTDTLQDEKAFRAESRNSSFKEESSGLIMESLNTDALLQEKGFRTESRKSSLREEKSSGLIVESSHKDMYLGASSDNNLNTETPLEEKALRADSRKSILREKKTVEQQSSFKQVEENNLMKQQLAEELHVEAQVEEGMQRKNASKDASLGVTTEISVSQMLGEEYLFEEQQNRMTSEDDLQEKGIIDDTSITEGLIVKNLIEMKKMMSSSDGISANEMPSGASNEVTGKEASSDIEESPESVSKQVDDVPPIGKGMQELIGSTSLGALAAPDDFAAAAKAIAAEAARLAVLDYAKRIAGSGAIPVDLTDLTNFGVDFKEGSQVPKKLHSEGKSELVDSQEVQDGGDIINDAIKEEATKVEITVNDDGGIYTDYAKFGGTVYADKEKSMNSTTPVPNDGANGNITSSNTLGHTGTLPKDELSLPDTDSGNYEINPFATELDKTMSSLFSGTGEDDSASWFSKTKPELRSKAGGFVQEDDHLDIFFTRKTPRLDEDGYGFVKLNPSLMEEKVPYFGYDKKERISQDKFFVSAPMFDSFPEKQSVLIEESSDSFKTPVFDDGEPEEYDASSSFDDGLDKSSVPVGLSDQKRPQSLSNIKSSAHFDPEPEPSFDKPAEEEEQSSMEKSESTQAGQLKWQSKKPTKASEEATSGETLTTGEASKPSSRRTKRQPQRGDEYAYGSQIPAQDKLLTDGGPTSKMPQGSSSSLMQQQRKEPGRYDVAETGNLRNKPAESFAYSSDLRGQRPARSHNRVSYDFPNESKSDRWDSNSTVEDRFPTIKTTKSPSRSSQQQKMAFDESDEDFYFSEETGNSSARSSMNRRTIRSPTRVAKQQFLPQGDDDAESYKLSNKASRLPNFSRQDLADDDSFEELPVARYKPFRQSEDLGMDTSANLAMYRQKKPHHQQEDYKSESMHMQYSGVGKNSPTSKLPARRKHQNGEDEDDLASGYKPSVQVDGRGKSSSSRPLSSRTKIEEEEPHLASSYKPNAQVDDLGRASSSPLSGRRQRYRLPQEEEQVVLMKQNEQEEFYSKPLPDRWQGDHHKDPQRMPRPLYGQKQDLRLEKENSDSSIDDHDQEYSEQPRPSILSEQEQQCWQLPAYGQKKQHRPLSLSQEYEECMPGPRYGRKQDLRKEEENLDLTVGDYGHPIFSEQKQDGKETKHRPLPSYRQENRQPSPPSYAQEEEFESMPLPDWRQEKLCKEKKHMSRPLYGQKQDSRLVEGVLDLSAEEYEHYREEQRYSTMLSGQEQGGQEKQRRRLPPYRQENQHRPLQPLQQYEQEEENEEFDSMPWLQEERRKEEEHISRPFYGRKQDLRSEKANLNSSIEDLEQQQEQPGHTSMSSEQEQFEQEKQCRSLPHGGQLDSKIGRNDSETWKQEKIWQEQQQLSLDRQQQQSLAEDVARKGQQGRKKDRLPLPVFTRQQEIQEDKKFSKLSMEYTEQQKEEQLQYSTAMSEGKQEQDGQRNEKPPWPLRNRKQEFKDEAITGRKQQSLAKEEGMKGQQEKSEIKEQLPARQSLPKDEGPKDSQAKPSTGRPPSLPAQSTSSPLESSLSDPVFLATIPPPTKKPLVQPPPAATTLESSTSAPPTSPLGVKEPKVPQRPPNVEDLLANFEALRRARKGE